MKAPNILSTALVVAGSLVVGSPIAAQPGTGMDPPDLLRPAPNLMLVQGTQDWPSDRMMRLRQHRAIIEDALRPPRRRMPAEPVEPQARPLQRPEPMVRTAPPEPQREPQQEALPEQPDLSAEAQGRVSCDEAAGIIADFGFSDVRPADCSSNVYRFSAMRDGTAYSIGVAASDGEIAEVSRE